MAEDKKKAVARQTKWDKSNLRRFEIKFHNIHDAEIIEFLEKQENVKGYIKSLILADIKKEGAG